MKNPILVLIGRLLFLANNDVSSISYRKKQFYDVKTKLLQRYGTRQTVYMQHIRKECWDCNSTGIYKSKYKLPETCWSCNGTGVYQEYWSRLQQYKLGNYEFFVPQGKESSYTPLFEGMALPVIEGFIKPQSIPNNYGREAVLWLYLFFDFKAFYTNLIQKNYIHRTPLLFTGNAIYRFVLAIKNTIQYFKEYDYTEYYQNKLNTPDGELPF